jgi:hypothetical protein
MLVIIELGVEVEPERKVDGILAGDVIAGSRASDPDLGGPGGVAWRIMVELLSVVLVA